MPKKLITKEEYTERANLLRKVGYKLSYKGNKKSTWTPQAKAIITNIWEDKGVFYLVNTEKNRLEFKRFRSRSSQKKWKSFGSPEQVFPKGVFIQRPKGVKKGEWKAKLRGKRLFLEGKRVHDVVIKLDMLEIAEDPKKALEKVLKDEKRPAQFMLNVNGLDAGKSDQPFEDLETFNRYLEESLIPELQQKEFDFEKWGHRVFNLKLIYTKKGKKKKGEGKRFDFEKGGIFDASSKRVYGLRKFMGVKVPKTDKRRKGK